MQKIVELIRHEMEEKACNFQEITCSEADGHMGPNHFVGVEG